jgi:hypothetical protein
MTRAEQLISRRSRDFASFVCQKDDGKAKNCANAVLRQWGLRGSYTLVTWNPARGSYNAF